MSNGNGSGQLVETAGALVRANRPQERTEIERRRYYVGMWRFGQRLSERQIAERLARLDPPIITTQSTVSRDVQRLRAEYRRQFSQHGFDPRAAIGIVVTGIEHIITASIRDAHRTRDQKERALHRKVALDAYDKLAALYQDTGLVRERDFLLPPDDESKRADRIPSGEEIQKRFEAITIPEGELISEAERAWSYGDQVAAEAAANAARGASRDDQREGE